MSCVSELPHAVTHAHTCHASNDLEKESFAILLHLTARQTAMNGKRKNINTTNHKQKQQQEEQQQQKHSRKHKRFKFKEHCLKRRRKRKHSATFTADTQVHRPQQVGTKATVQLRQGSLAAGVGPLMGGPGGDGGPWVRGGGWGPAGGGDAAAVATAEHTGVPPADHRFHLQSCW